MSGITKANYLQRGCRRKVLFAKCLKQRERERKGRVGGRGERTNT
jgi:hypothetical protein